MYVNKNLSFVLLICLVVSLIHRPPRTEHNRAEGKFFFLKCIIAQGEREGRRPELQEYQQIVVQRRRIKKWMWNGQRRRGGLRRVWGVNGFKIQGWEQWQISHRVWRDKHFTVFTVYYPAPGLESIMSFNPDSKQVSERRLYSPFTSAEKLGGFPKVIQLWEKELSAGQEILHPCLSAFMWHVVCFSKLGQHSEHCAFSFWVIFSKTRNQQTPVFGTYLACFWK